MDYILQYILPSILGSFISGIDKNHMRTNFFSGKVSLQGVALNPNLLKPLGIPLKIRYSDIGKLEVKIPWLKRLKEPIEVYLEDLSILLEQMNSMEDFDIVDQRMKFLEGLEEECSVKLKGLSNENAEGEGGSLDYYKILILDNLQLKIKNIHLRFENPSKGFSAGFTLNEINVHTINDAGQLMFIDRTLEENKLKDLFKRAVIKDLSIYWNSSEKHHNFITGDSYSDPHRKKFLLEYILRSDMKAADAEPILMISLESNLTFKNLNTSNQENDPRYKIDVDLKPITLTITSDQMNQMISLGDSFTAISHTRKNKYELPDLTPDEVEKESKEYKEALEDFLSNYQDIDFRWTEELENPKKRTESENIKRLLSRLPNKALVSVSKDVIINYEKNKLLIRYEKKVNKKGFMGMFSSSDKNAAEDLQKMESFFDSFIKQNADSIGKNLSKGLILQLNINLSESNLFLIHNKTQQGVLCAVRQLKIKFEALNTETADILNFLLNVGSAEFFFVQKYPGSQFMKKTPVLKKIKSEFNKDLATIGLSKKKSGKNELIEIKCDVCETEFNYMPEFVIVLKKFFTFQKNTIDSKFAEIAYEKLADMQKNAQDQLKLLINEYSSTFSVSISIAAVTVVIPLIPSLGLESDGWIISIGYLTLKSELDTADEQKIGKFNKFKKVMDKINVKYYEKISHYQALKLSNTDLTQQPTPFTLLNDTKIAVYLRLAEKPDLLPDDEAPTSVRVEIGKIGVNMSTLIHKKVLALSGCFDFSNEKDFSDYAETEKKSILRSSECLLKVYFQDRLTIGNKWYQYIMVCSGFYLYFYEHTTDIHYSKYFFLKNADIRIEKDKFDAPNVIKLKNKFEEIHIAMENEDGLNRLIKTIEKKNEKQLEHSLSIHFEDKTEETLSKEVKSLQDIKLDTLEKQQLKLNLHFEGLELLLIDSSQNITNTINMNHLGIEIVQRLFDSGIYIKLKEIYVVDFISVKSDQKFIMIMSSQSSTEEENPSHLISFEMRTYDQKHPHFQKNSKLKEFKLVFNQLELNWIPERIFYLLNFFSSHDTNNLDSDPKIVNKPLKIQESKEINYVGKKTESKDYIFSDGKVTINALSLNLITRFTWIKLAQFKLNNLNMSLTSDKNKSIYKGFLENIQCFDLTGYMQKVEPTEIIPIELIGIEKGQSLLEFYFESREGPYVKSLNSNLYNILSIVCHSVRINYVQQQVLRVVNYIMNFILSFDFGITKTIERRLAEATALIKREGFTDISVTFEHPKIILQSMPSSKVYFELDLGLITVKNHIAKNKARILKPIQGLNNIFTDTYNIQMSDAKLTKVINNMERSDLTSKFKLNLYFERMPWFEDWVLFKDISQNEKYDYFDNSHYINGSLTPLLLKLDQEDYLDFMDFVSFNLSGDDKKDHEYHIDEDVPSTQINEPTPLEFNLMMEYLGFLAEDQMINFPLSKIAAVLTELKYKKHRSLDKLLSVNIGKISASFYEAGYGYKLSEKTLFGRSLAERDLTINENGNLIEEILSYDMQEYLKQKDTIMKEKVPHMHLEMHMNHDGNKETILSLQEIKIILVMGVLMRLKDFFALPGNQEEQSTSVLANSSFYKTKSTTKITIEKAEISIPSNNESTLTFKSKISLDLANYDVLDLLKDKSDYLESSDMNISLETNEIFVFHNKSREKGKSGKNYTKRSIIYPFSIYYHTKEMLRKVQNESFYLSKCDSELKIDKIVIRASAVDSLILSSALTNIQEDMNQYKSWAHFPECSPHTERAFSNVFESVKDIKFESKDFKISHEGFLIRFINDFSGLSVPILDFSIHDIVQTQLIFNQDTSKFFGKNKFEISSSFFNPRAGMWEPIIEKWPFILELDFVSGTEIKQKIDIATEEKPLNINISDELLQSLLISYYDWLQNFKEPPKKYTQARDSIMGSQSLEGRTRTSTTMSKTLLQFLSAQEMSNEVEYVSPCTIWNDTGYPILVSPIVSGLTTKKNSDFDPRLQLDSGQEKELLVEWSIDKIFDASTNQSVLERLKVNLKIDFPQDSCNIFNIDIHNLGTKSNKVNLINIRKQFPIVCNVFIHKNKKLVRFSSPVVIKNALNIPLYIRIYDTPEIQELTIKPHDSRAIPVDKIEHMISFHESGDFKDTTFPAFQAQGLDRLDQVEIKLGNNNAIIRTHQYRAYGLIFIEPLVVVKNCLPFPVTADIVGKIGSKTEKITKHMDTQDSFQLLTFDSKYEISLKLSTSKFGSNEFTVQPFSLKNMQEFYFINESQKVMLELFVPIGQESYTKTFIISAKACIINESYEQLTFYSYTENSLTSSNFYVPLNNGIECVLFDNITALKIGVKNDLNRLTEPINLHMIGTVNEDIEDGTDKIYNLGVKVSQELADNKNNIFTRVVSITPRFIFINRSKLEIEIYQPEVQIKRYHIRGRERKPFHFNKATKDNNIIVHILSDPKNISSVWLPSGTLDVSSPSDIQFVCQSNDKKISAFLNLSVTLQDGYMFLTLDNQKPEDALIQIQNDTGSFDLEVSQYGIKDLSFFVPNGQKKPFSWSEPFGETKIVVKLLSKNDASVELVCSLDKLNQVFCENLKFKTGEIPLSYYVYLHGSSRVLRFYTLKPRDTEKKQLESDTLIRAHLPCLGVSLISAAGTKKKEIAYICLAPIMFVMVGKNDTTSIHLRIKALIIDNNSTDEPLYPVMVFPEQAAKLRDSELPYMDIVCKIQNKKKDSDIFYIKDLGFYLYETNICLDGNTLNAFSDFIRSINKIMTRTISQEREVQQYLFLSAEKKDQIKKNIQNYLSWQTIDPKQASSDFIYIEKLAIQPIMLNITFKNLQFGTSSTFIFNFLKKALGKALANFDRAPIRLKGIELTHTYGTKVNVIGTLKQRYKSVTVDTVMGIIFSSNILGNPGKLFSRISSGFNDLLDKPVKGFLEGPIEGGIGIVAGAGSFAAKTVGATFHSLHNIADSLASGMAVLSGVKNQGLL